MNPLKRLRHYTPNRGTKLALVHIDDTRPFRAYWPLHLTQLIGGKTWSISFITHPHPARRVEGEHGYEYGVERDVLPEGRAATREPNRSSAESLALAWRSRNATVVRRAVHHGPWIPVEDTHDN